MQAPVQALIWRDDHLALLDQRALPEAIVYLDYFDAVGVAEAIRAMVVRGAPAIGCAAAYGVACEAFARQTLPAEQFRAALDTGIKSLAASRPTAVNLFWALERMRRSIESGPPTPPQLALHLAAEAQAIQAGDLAVNRAIGQHGAKLLPPGCRVLTHCNAGALATAGHGTALGVIRSARDAGLAPTVVATETRPYLQGARLTAWEMVQEGIPITLITDNMAGHILQRQKIDAVVVGTDRVVANGDVANKIGTYPLAVLAQRHNVPFYVACPLSTIDMATTDGAAIEIEERAMCEVLGFRSLRWAADGVTVANPAFDVTPAALVTALITERGVVFEPNRNKLERLFTPRSSA
jgi:methylthioribose-1-phosphate isomerase